MALIEACGRPHLECQKCNTVVVWPADLPENLKTHLAQITRHDTLAGMQFAQEQLGLDPRESKALVLHVTRADLEDQIAAAMIERLPQLQEFLVRPFAAVIQSSA